MAHIARGAHGDAHTTDHRADAGEPRDRSAGRIVPLEIARLGEAARAGPQTPIAGVEFGADGSDEETFPGCKALESHEIGLGSAERPMKVPATPSAPASSVAAYGWAPTAGALSSNSAPAPDGKNGPFARKWRRNSLKRLNPRPEMVVSRKPPGHNIWYTCARLTVPSG